MVDMLVALGLCTVGALVMLRGLESREREIDRRIAELRCQIGAATGIVVREDGQGWH